MKKLAALGSVALLITVVATGCAAPQEMPEEKGESSELILGGTDDSGHDAVAIVRAVTSPTTVSLCTGTLIRSNIMITAGHCAFNGTTQLHDVDVSFAARPNISAPLGDKSWVAGKIFPNPQYTGVGGSGEDVAVIVLDRDVAITPMKLAKAPAVGSTVTAVGYGWNAQGTSPSGDTSKRKVAIPVTKVDAHEIAAGRDNLGTCHGDSGGPLLQNERIVGLVSYGDTADCKGTSHFTRADDVADFIQSMIAAAGGDDGADALPAGDNPNPPKAQSCSTSISCINGACTCGSGPNEGKSCEGKLGSANSCSTICSTCSE